RSGDVSGHLGGRRHPRVPDGGHGAAAAGARGIIGVLSVARDLESGQRAKRTLRGEMTRGVTRLVSSFSAAAVVGAMLLVVAAAQTPAGAPARGEPTQGIQAAHEAGSEANLVLPDLSQVAFRGINARTLLTGGLFVCVLGLLFGLMVFTQTK